MSSLGQGQRIRALVAIRQPSRTLQFFFLFQSFHFLILIRPLHNAFFIPHQHSPPQAQAVALRHLDLVLLVFCWLLLTFPSCCAELPSHATTLAARDWSDDSHNWLQIMQTLQNTGSHIGIPIQGFQTFQLSTPLLLEVQPYDLVMVPSQITPDLAVKLVEVDKREPIMFCTTSPGQHTERCKGQEENLNDFFADLRAHEVSVVVAKGRLQKAPIRMADTNSNSVIAVFENKDREPSRLMVVYQTKPFAAFETPSPADLGKPTRSPNDGVYDLLSAG